MQTMVKNLQSTDTTNSNTDLIPKAVSNVMQAHEKTQAEQNTKAVSKDLSRLLDANSDCV